MNNFNSAQKLIKSPNCIGDLGTTAKEVEVELEKNFALASRWGCILLLDEADVFLSARERTDFIRNGLVAGRFLSLFGPDFRFPNSFP